MKHFDTEGIAIFLLIGIFFVIVSFSIAALCVFTLKKVRTVSKYCNEQFEKINAEFNKISILIHKSNQTTEDLHKTVSEVNKNLQLINEVK